MELTVRYRELTAFTLVLFCNILKIHFFGSDRHCANMMDARNMFSYSMKRKHILLQALCMKIVPLSVCRMPNKVSCLITQ